MEKVKAMIAAGVSIPTAIKESLGMTLTLFAETYGLPLNDVSQVVNGAQRATERQLAALIAELGGTEKEWREILWLAGKPETSAA